MTWTDRPQLQYAALILLAAGGIFCALFLAGNPIMAAGYAGVAAISILVVTGAILTRQDRAKWEPRLQSPLARRSMDVLSVAVIACFVIGLILIPFA